MRILLDTNILIQRENNHIIPENLAELMRLLNGLENCSLHIHPLTRQEIMKDGYDERKNVNLSKSNTYSVLEKVPNYLDDENFKNLLPEPKSENDIVDNQLIYCIARNICDYLITQDQGLLNKASTLEIENVININEAINIFKKFYTNVDIPLGNNFEIRKVFELNYNDKIFDSLKDAYKGFDKWWNSIQNRDTYVYFNSNNDINAILIPKIEHNEIISENPLIKKNKILKICTFKVAEHARGLKLGEKLINLAIKFAESNDLGEIYLSHYVEENDYLVNLIKQFGFKHIGNKGDNEAIFIKNIYTNENVVINSNTDAINFDKTFYPAFYDGNLVRKHLVPILPVFHKKLFPDSHAEVHQLELNLFENSEGNCIKKAYVCRANTTKINKGDILLFYQSKNRMALTTIGTVLNVYPKMTDPEEVFKLISKRTVFTFEDIKKWCRKELLVILFNENFHLKQEVKLPELSKFNIEGNIYSIREIQDVQYRQIIKGNIDERFTIH